jgi:hypothetical protein
LNGVGRERPLTATRPRRPSRIEDVTDLIVIIATVVAIDAIVSASVRRAGERRLSRVERNQTNIDDEAGGV